MRRALVIACCAIVLAGVLYAANRHGEPSDFELARYYVASFHDDTGAQNAVAAIYLNYRVYDTLFEALILLAAISAMLHFFEIGGRK